MRASLILARLLCAASAARAPVRRTRFSSPQARDLMGVSRCYVLVPWRVHTPTRAPRSPLQPGCTPPSPAHTSSCSRTAAHPFQFPCSVPVRTCLFESGARQHGPWSCRGQQPRHHTSLTATPQCCERSLDGSFLFYLRKASLA